jgi:hypothetical protein
MSAPLNLTGATGASAPAFTVQVNKAAFLASVQQYINLSPIQAEVLVIKKLSWPGCLLPPTCWTTITDLEQMISLICSAVELAKEKLIQQSDPTGKLGAKVDNELALTTAVQILGSYVTFGGFIGILVERLKEEILNAMVSLWVDGQAVSWIPLAEKILGVAL